MALNIEEKITALVEPFVEAKGATLWGVKYRGSRDHALLQIFIESEDGVSADLCGDITNMISPALDAEDIINPAYTLEVSSPGLDRILFNIEQVQKYINSKLKIELKIPQNGRKKLEGTLERVEGSELYINDKVDGEVVIDFANISIARLVPDFSIARKK